jgi:cytoskeleton protein RodZ
MTDKEQPVQEMPESAQPELTGIGDILKQARTNARLSAQDVAATLNLTESQIIALEEEAFDSLGPQTFVKGYIKSYCKLFKLEQQDVLQLFPQKQEQVTHASMQSFSRRTEREAHDSRLMLISYVIIALLIGSSIYFVLQSRDDSDAVPAITETAEQISEPTSNDVDEDDTLQLADALPLTESSIATELAPSQIQAITANPVTSEAEQQEAMEAVLQTVVMTFGEDSWVEILDATGDKIAFGVKKQGYTMTVAGKAPFFVTLGRPGGVQVSLDGQPIDVSHLPTTRTAKFNLPLDEQ